ncbi:SDR family oxidoreductase [Methylobacillus glycogenes]|uniref:SDR family oxidoreductase n=1 Tax=Methylobacillus glycogenes TaxID=406 RepID=UPI000471C576|nr:SDR family oxidoreductase [Methylobacillus glycogenes]
MSHVLIAGFGDLGQELARRLQLAGHQTTGLRRNAGESEGVISADVSNPETLHTLAELKPDILVYCVAASEHSDENYRLSYVEGLRNVLAALASVTLRHIFFVSSTGVYGQETQDVLDETTPAIATEFSGVRMLEAEALLQGLPATVLRFSGIYGPGRLRMITLAREPQKWPPRNGWTNRIHRDDGAAFIVYLIAQLGQQPLAALYVVTDHQPLPMYDLLHWLAAQQGVEANAVTVPAVSGNKRLSNQRMLATGYAFIYPDYVAGYTALLADLPAG